jgi:5,10-methylenetetrahydromethanopterin reductase
MTLDTTPNTTLDRIGGYVLPGGPLDARPAIDQARALEAAGLGSIYIGERYATKDLGAIAGALTQSTSTPRLIAAITHIGTRHPMALASLGQTLQSLSDGRFTLGFGRGSAGRWASYGVRAPTSVMLADTVDILRRLWAGERVSYDGPAGTFPDLQLMELADVPPPRLLMAGIGPRTLELAGRAFDGAILHPLLTPDAVERSTTAVRRAAADAGRDPDAVEIHATVITAPDRPAGEPQFDEVVGARGLGYLLVAGLGESIVAANGWDPTELATIRSRFDGLDYHRLKSVPVAELATISTELPEGWLLNGTASGSFDRCASRIDEYLRSGATHVLLHGLDADAVSPLARAIDMRDGVR